MLEKTFSHDSHSTTNRPGSTFVSLLNRLRRTFSPEEERMTLDSAAVSDAPRKSCDRDARMTCVERGVRRSAVLHSPRITEISSAYFSLMNRSEPAGTFSNIASSGRSLRYRGRKTNAAPSSRPSVPVTSARQGTFQRVEGMKAAAVPPQSRTRKLRRLRSPNSSGTRRRPSVMSPDFVWKTEANTRIQLGQGVHIHCLFPVDLQTGNRILNTILRNGPEPDRGFALKGGSIHHDRWN